MSGNHHTGSGESDGAADTNEYLLTLYVTGTTSKSIRAITNLKRVCEEHLKGRYTLEVVDIYQQPERARSGQIVAAPTLIKSLPVPLRTFIGDMADTERILVGLDLKPRPSGGPTHEKRGGTGDH
jgi:circadian clock protein KaiB